MRRMLTSTPTTASSATTSTTDTHLDSDCSSSRSSSISPLPVLSERRATAVSSNASQQQQEADKSLIVDPQSRLRPDPLHRQSYQRPTDCMRISEDAAASAAVCSADNLTIRSNGGNNVITSSNSMNMTSSRSDQQVSLLSSSSSASGEKKQQEHESDEDADGESQGVVVHLQSEDPLTHQLVMRTDVSHKSHHQQPAHHPALQLQPRSSTPERLQSSFAHVDDGLRDGAEDGSVTGGSVGDQDSCLSIQSYCPSSLLSHESIASSSSSSSSTGNTSDSGSSSLLTMAPESLTGCKPFRSFRSSEDYLIAMKEDLADWLNQLYDLDMRVENFISTLETGVILCRHANNVIQKARELRASGSPVPDYFLSPKVPAVPPVRGSSSGRSTLGTTAPSSRHHQSSGVTHSLMKSSHSFSGSPAGLLTSRRSLGAIHIPSKLMTRISMTQASGSAGTDSSSNCSSRGSTPGTEEGGGGVGGKLTVTTTTTGTTADSGTTMMTAATAGQRLALNDANQKDHSLQPESRLTQSINDVRNDSPNDQNPPNDQISCRTTSHTANNNKSQNDRENGGPSFQSKTKSTLISNNNNNNSYTISCRKNAARGTFHARDNVCNFITWCRSLQIRECLLFETEDLVLGKNEKSVILCLLEVARKGSMLGMSIPLLIQLEQEIDQEIESDERKHQQEMRMSEQSPPPPLLVVQDPTPKSVTRIPILSRTRNHAVNPLDEEDEQQEDEVDNDEEDEPRLDAKHGTTVASNVDPQHDSQYNSETDSDTSSTTFTSIGPQPQIVTNDLKSLHEHVVELLNRCTCPSQYPMIKVSDGKYRIGDTKTLIFVRILRRHVMVRVGGGWDTLEHYLDKHDPCRCYYLMNGGGGRRRSSTAGLTSAGSSFNLKNGVKV